jgi:hypothetical protein
MHEIGWFSSLSFKIPVKEMYTLLNKTCIVHMTDDGQDVVR